jgi:hypothetical protein
MTSWADFAMAAPDLAAEGLARFNATGLSLIGTLRRDGSPRISAVEPFHFEGDLALGMMWRSMKALDLLRDPRCVVHSTISDKDGRQGEFKVYGRAVAVDDLPARNRYCVALRAATGWAPEGDQWHLWCIDIDQVSWFRVLGDGGHEVDVWRPASGPGTADLDS